MPYNPSTQGMGIGNVGVGGTNVIFKRKHRWTLEIKGRGTCKFNITPFFVKTAARPSYTADDIEINFLNDTTWIPGKVRWNPITIVYLDNNQGSTEELIQWFTALYDFTSATSKKMSSTVDGYGAEVNLTMWDGCGNAMETWKILDAWPQQIDFGDLDYGSADIAEIELTLRYSQVEYTPKCKSKLTKCDCTGC